MKKWKLFLFTLAGMLVFGIGAQKKVHDAQMQQEIAQKILRFHVIANSDSKQDQALKLQVRDAIGDYMAKKLQGVESRSQSETIVQENLAQIKAYAEQVIAQQGFSYTVKAALGNVVFPEKNYGIYTFAAGTYEALEVTIGKGEGHNWWCVMYPNLCFAGSVYTEPQQEDETTSVLQKVLTPEEYHSIMEQDEMELQCRYLKFLNPILEQFSKQKAQNEMEEKEEK